jgi:hypothetical protein
VIDNEPFGSIRRSSTDIGDRSITWQHPFCVHQPRWIARGYWH